LSGIFLVPLKGLEISGGVWLSSVGFEFIGSASTTCCFLILFAGEAELASLRIILY